MTKINTPTIYAIAGSPAAGKTSFVGRGLYKKKYFLIKLYVMTVMLLCSLKGYKANLKKLGSAAAFKKWEFIIMEGAAELIAIGHRASVNIFDNKGYQCFLDNGQKHSQKYKSLINPKNSVKSIVVS